MIVSSEQLKTIVAAGGGIVVDAPTWTFPQLRELCAAAQLSKASVTIRNIAALTGSQLRELALAAPGLVVFDLTTPDNNVLPSAT